MLRSNTQIVPRRRALVELGALAASLLAPACHSAPDRAAILTALVSDVVASDVKSVVAETRALDAALRALAEKPEPDAVHGAESALKRSLLVWKRAYAFRAGPLADGNVFLRAMFWPIRPSAIDAMLDGESVIDEALIEQLGANQKGLYALEYVLFGRARGANRAWSDQERRFVERASANVLGYAERGRRLFGSGDDYAQRFASGGQDSVAKLVELCADAVEVVFGKLDRVLRRKSQGTIGAPEVEGYFSRTSLEVALALLGGAERLFVGADEGGLGTLVGMVAPSVDNQVRARFRSAHDELRALGDPLELSVEKNPSGFAAAAAELRMLERALKLEVANALGLSIVITSGDGD